MTIKTKLNNAARPDDLANMFLDKYPQHINLLESHSAKTRVGESVSSYDVIALGQKLDAFSQYQRWCESQNLASLGVIPEIALDVITAVSTTSILPLLASTQVMAEEHGVVYFKQQRAGNTAGGYTVGDVISDPRALDNPATGGFGSGKKTINLGQVANGTTEYTFQAGVYPLRPYKVEVMSTAFGQMRDDGAGKLIGYGVGGTVNYATGEIKLNIQDPAAAADVVAVVDLDMDDTETIDSIRTALDSKEIRARIIALKTDTGAFANYAFSQRFNRSASDETAQDLTDELTRILNTEAILTLARAVPTAADPATWKITPGAGVGALDHKTGFVDVIAKAERNMHLQSGVSSANRLVAGINAAAVIRGMPGFVPAAEMSLNSVGLYGYLDGVPVIRASHVLDDNQALTVGNVGGYFNAPLVEAPFMPLMMTDTIESSSNPFKGTRAAAVWTGLEAVNPNLVSYINFVQ